MQTATAPPATSLEVDLATLLDAPYNPRVALEHIEDLADSIRTDGVLEPLLVRVHPTRKGKYEIIAGHRRAAAANKAGLDRVPVRLLKVDDKAARRICVTENLQREDLHPLEEARAIQTLVADVGVAAAADQVGKSIRYIARRANLVQLSPKWTKAIGKDPKVASYPAKVLDLVALLAPDEQDELLLEFVGNDGVIPELEWVERLVGMSLRTLKRATWKLDDAELVPKQGACTDCTRHSGASIGLFEDSVDGDLKAATCRDVSCWRQKATAVSVGKLASAREQHGGDLLLVGGSWSGARRRRRDDSDGLGEAALDSWDYKTVKKGTKGAVPAFVVEGKGTGTVRWIKPDSTRGGSRRATKALAPKVEPGTAEDLKAKRARLKSRRDGFSCDWIRERVEKTDDIPAGLPETGALSLAALAYAYGVPTSLAGWDFASRKKAAAGHEANDLWRAVQGRLCDAITRHNAQALAGQLKEARWFLEVLWPEAPDLFKAMGEAAAEAIPKPRNLVALEKRGTRVFKKKVVKKKLCDLHPEAKRKAAKRKPAKKKAVKRKAVKKGGAR